MNFLKTICCHCCIDKANYWNCWVLNRHNLKGNPQKKDDLLYYEQWSAGRSFTLKFIADELKIPNMTDLMSWLQERPQSCQAALHKICCKQFVTLGTLEGVTTHCTDIQQTTATKISFIQCACVIIQSSQCKETKTAFPSAWMGNPHIHSGMRSL